MLDIRFIRENADLVQSKSKQKGYEVDIRKLLELDEHRRQLMSDIEIVRAERNKLADQAKGQEPSPEAVEKGKHLKQHLSDCETRLKPVEEEFDKILANVPNVFPDDTPEGGEENNREEKTWGGKSGREAVDHLSWGEKTGYIDFERGAKVAGNKFYFLKGPLVEMEIAILQLAMSLAKDQDFVPISVPHLVNSRMINGTGFAARGEEKQIYKVEDEDLHLIATAEIPLTGYHADEIFDETALPKLYMGFSPAYRLEAGAYGKHSRGLYRVHQFNKLEMYVFCKPEESELWHQKMVELEEKICQELGIPYRVVRIAAGDLGAPAYKKFDIEYYSPTDKTYHELMSCSNVTDYQARRLNIKYKTKTSTNYVHTLNGTAAAMSRMIIAIIENYQTTEGRVKVPEALQKYLSGQTEI